MVHGILHNLKVFVTLMSINLKITLTYRVSLLISLILNFFWVISYVIFMEVIFRNVPTLGGMTKGETLLIMAFFYFFTNISDIFYRDSFEQFSDKMRTGYIDTWLTKPASSRMLMFLSNMRFDYLTAIGVSAALFSYAYSHLEAAPNYTLFCIGILLTFASHIIFFSILSIIATFTFWLQKNDALNIAAWHMTQVARYPRSIYTSFAKIAFTYMFPLALIANLPAEVSLNKATPNMLIFFAIITTTIYIVSLSFWKWGLKRYTSAG